MTTNITEEMKASFKAIQECNNVALFSCFVNGQPSTAIAFVNRDGEDYTITPQWVWITPAMILTDHDDVAPGPL